MDEEAEPLPFVSSMTMRDGVGAVLASIRQTIGLDLAEFRAQSSPETAFALLRSKVEAASIFVLLIGNLGSHHTAIDVEAFRGFALADKIAPFVVLNDQDAKTAWSFSLLHELAHIWLGTTGISGGFAETQIERFCNDVAGGFLLPANELPAIRIDRGADLSKVAQTIAAFAAERHISGSMAAYRLRHTGAISEEMWLGLRDVFGVNGAAAGTQRERLVRMGQVPTTMSSGATGSGPPFYTLHPAVWLPVPCHRRKPDKCWVSSHEVSDLSYRLSPALLRPWRDNHAASP